MHNCKAILYHLAQHHSPLILFIAELFLYNATPLATPRCQVVNYQFSSFTCPPTPPMPPSHASLRLYTRYKAYLQVLGCREPKGEPRPIYRLWPGLQRALWCNDYVACAGGETARGETALWRTSRDSDTAVSSAVHSPATKLRQQSRVSNPGRHWV